MVAHLTAGATLGPARWLAGVIGCRFDFDRQVAMRLAEHLGASPAETLAGFERVRTSTTAPPLARIALLGEVIVHGEDVRRPLGIRRDYPIAVATRLARYYRTSNQVVVAKDRVAGLRLTATDGPFATGDGPLLSGPTVALVLAMTGRAAYCDDLTGDVCDAAGPLLTRTEGREGTDAALRPSFSGAFTGSDWRAAAVDPSHGRGLPPGERNVHRVFGRRVVWSPWWWFAVAGLGLVAVLLLFWPVRFETASFGTTECGTLIAPDVDNGEVAGGAGPPLKAACANLRGVHWQLILAVLATSAVPAWLGWRDNRHADVGPTWVIAAVCVGASVFLLISPQSSGQLYQCGSALLRTTDTLERYEGEDAVDDCAATWSGRVAWAGLLGTAAIPFAMSAARRRDD